MHDVRASRLIDTPPERVFERVDDWPNSPIPRLRLRPRDGEVTHGLGASFTGHWPLTPLAAAAVVQGEASILDHYYPERTVLGWGTGASIGWTLGRVGDRTLVELRVQYRLPGGLVGRFLGDAIALSLGRDLNATVARLERELTR